MLQPRVLSNSHQWSNHQLKTIIGDVSVQAFVNTDNNKGPTNNWELVLPDPETREDSTVIEEEDVAVVISQPTAMSHMD